LKALDFTCWESMGRPFADAVGLLANAYTFERNVVLQCANKRMTNVVRGIDAGEVSVEPTTFDPQFAVLSKVPYIIFEMAEGDIRKALADVSRALDHAWALRVLHGATNGLRQLHQADIAHQDIKPSNIMTFPELVKIGDLGRSSAGGSGFNGHEFPGDSTYSPPEFLYREINPDDRARQRAGDLYQLGSLAVFLFSGHGLTALLTEELGPEFHWRTWPRDYRNALPFVRDAYDRVMLRVAATLPQNAPTLLPTIRDLADPDPFLRGSPKGGAGVQRYGLERYVSVFDRLARAMELNLRGSAA
jgi:eukaryotic-like serine/threonine-protein kinase